jgi:hypothetical protein
MRDEVEAMPLLRGGPMRRTLACTLVLLALLSPSSLDAQRADSTIRYSPYVAVGGDVLRRGFPERTPLFLSAGLERARSGSPWSLRLGADYRRQTVPLARTRWEDFGVGISARYAGGVGAIRPYLLGGVGIANLRVGGPWVKYNQINGTISGPVDSSFTFWSRWNGSITSGLGTEVTVGPLRLFGEARLNLYPARLSDAPRPAQMLTTKALFLGVKF